MKQNRNGQQLEGRDSSAFKRVRSCNFIANLKLASDLWRVISRFLWDGIASVRNSSISNVEETMSANVGVGNNNLSEVSQLSGDSTVCIGETKTITTL